MAYAISDGDRRLNYFFRGQEGDPEHVFEYAQGLGKWAGMTEDMVLLQRVKEARKPMATLHLYPPDSAAGRGAEEVEYREAIRAAVKEMGLHIHRGGNAGELVVVKSWDTRLGDLLLAEQLPPFEQVEPRLRELLQRTLGDYREGADCHARTTTPFETGVIFGYPLKEIMKYYGALFFIYRTPSLTESCCNCTFL